MLEEKGDIAAVAVAAAVATAAKSPSFAESPHTAPTARVTVIMKPSVLLILRL